MGLRGRGIGVVMLMVSSLLALLLGRLLINVWGEIGTGSCLAKASGTSFPAGTTATETVTTKPAGWVNPGPFSWGSEREILV